MEIKIEPGQIWTNNLNSEETIEIIDKTPMKNFYKVKKHNKIEIMSSKEIFYFYSPPKYLMSPLYKAMYEKEV